MDKAALANDFVTVTQNNQLLSAKANTSDLTALANSVPTQINAEIATLVGTAPQTLNTLQELAAALDNDANYAATIQTQLSNKANKSDVYDKATVDDYITDKQDILYVATDPNAASLMDGALGVIKCLATTSPLTYTDAARKITLALDDIALANTFLRNTIADQLFSGKANAADVYTKSATYTQSQVNGLVATKQNILSIQNDNFTAPLINGNTIKCLTTTSPLTYTDVNNKITLA